MRDRRLLDSDSSLLIKSNEPMPIRWVLSQSSSSKNGNIDEVFPPIHSVPSLLYWQSSVRIVKQTNELDLVRVCGQK